MGHIKIDIDQILCIGTVRQLMGTLLSRGKENQLTGRDIPLPLRRTQEALTADNIKGFLVIVVKMVGIGRFSRRDLINADQGILRLAKGDKPTAKVLIPLMFTLMPDRDIFNFRMFDTAHFKTLSARSARLLWDSDSNSSAVPPV